MEIKVKLSTEEHKELVSYCNLNDLLISSVVKNSFTTGFNIERYGLLNSQGQETKEIIKEVIVEKKIEIPVEVVKEVVKVEYVEVEKPVEKIVEVIKEVPVEKIIETIKEVPIEKVIEKTVEVIKEIPVEKVVIKEVLNEVPVEKIVYVTDQKELQEKIFEKDQEFEQQRKIFSTKTQEMENIFQDSLAKKNKELDELRQSLDELLDKPPVEKIVEVIKEVIVEKKVENTNSSKEIALQNTVMKLREDNIEKEKKIIKLEETIKEIQSVQNKQAVYLRGSNLDDKLYK